MNGYPLSSSFIGAIGQYPISQILNIDKLNNTTLSSSGEINFSNVNNFNTKIDNQGVLRVFYTQNIAVPTVPTQWLSVVDSLGYLYGQDVQNQLQFTEINNSIIGLTTALGETTLTANSAEEIGIANSAAITLLTATVGDVSSQFQYYLPLAGGTLTGALTTNSDITYKGTELTTKFGNYLLKAGGTLTGALTTNYDVTYKGEELTTKFGNYLLKAGGTLTGAVSTNSDITYKGEELTTKFGNYLLKEGGTMTGRININTGLYGTPVAAFGNGDRITLNPSSSPSTYPYSIGVNTNNLWHCIPNGASYNWYVDNVSKLSLSSAGDITTSGIVNLTTTNSYLNFGSRTQNDLIRLYGTTYGFGVAANILRYYADAAASHKFYSGATNTATISPAGDISATTFSGGGGNITGINYNNISVNALSFTLPLSKSGTNAVSINLSAYQPIINTYTITGATGGSFGFATGTLTLGMPTTYSALSIASLTSATSIIYKGAEISSSYLKLDGTNNMVLNAGIALTGTGKFSGDGSLLTALNYNNITNNALSFQTPLSKSVANQVSIDLSAYSPTSVNDTRYLRLNGTNDMANTLNIRILNQYAIDIQTTDSTAPNCIAFKNNTTSYGFIGLPGTTYTGNYANNLFLQSTNGIIFNSGGITSTGTPKMIIMAGGNIGIGTTNALQKLHIQGGATTAMIRIETNTDAENQTTGIEFGIPSFTSIKSAKITSTSLTGNKSDLKFYTRNGTAVDAYNYMTLSSGGDLIIGGVNGVNLATTENRITTNGSTLCGVFGGDSLLSSYWGVAVNINFGGLGDNANAGNTKIQYTSSFTINTRTSATSSGFDKTLFTVRNSGNVGIGTTDPTNKLQIENGNFRVYNGAGQIRGVSSYINIATSMATGSLTIGDTSKNFGGGTNWNTNVAGLLMECQNNTEIAIHDADTRIASFMYYAGGGINQFYIGRDMGWGTISQTNFYGNINIINSLTNKLIFDDNTNSTKIQLYTGYSFGINASTLRYDSAGVHKFLTNNNQTFIIDADGNTRATGNMTASAYSTASRYYCSATYVSFSSIVQGGSGLTYYGWFVGLNGYWYTGYSYLTISASVNMAGSGNIFCWNGRVYLSPAGGLVSVGGVLQITTDYKNPVSGDNAINVQEMWDGWGNNYLRFYGTNLNAGLLTIKIYG